MAITALIVSTVLGAVLGESFRGLFSTVENVISKTRAFKSNLQQLEKTLDVLDPLVKDIEQSDRKLDRSEKETRDLIQQLKKGEKLVSACLNLKGWKYVKRCYYANKLCNLNKALSRLLPSCRTTRDNLEILGKVNDLCEQGNLAGIKDVLKESMGQLKTEGSMALLLTASRRRGTTTRAKMGCPDKDIKETQKDIILWRRKKLSVAVLSVATAIWVLMEVYQFNFVTVISWAAMSLVVALFLWTNILWLLGKEPPNMSGLESAIKTANFFRAWIEEGIRWVFQVSAERDWCAFAGIVFGLWLLSYVGKFFDLLTLLYMGIIMGMTVPVVYIKYEEHKKSKDLKMEVKTRRRRKKNR